MTVATILALCLGVLGAPAPSLLPQDPLEQEWRWSEIGRESGLPEGLVRQLVLTEDGEMWVLVGDLLAVFDGYGWEVVPTAFGQILSALAGSVERRVSNKSGPGR